MKKSSKQEFPEFAKLPGGVTGCVLVLARIDKSGYAAYYRVAGAWTAYFRWRDGKLVCTNSPHKECYHMRGLELTECTEEEFRNDNRGYLHLWGMGMKERVTKSTKPDIRIEVLSGDRKGEVIEINTSIGTNDRRW